MTDFEEVELDFSWGKLTGKWYGPRDVRPIVLIHGWQDSAGTFDLLTPMLPKHLSYFAIDLPGHGWSSRIPNGMSYHCFDVIFIFNDLMQHFKWPKISLMGHSMGALIAFYFSAFFNDRVDMVVAIDALKPRVVSSRRNAYKLMAFSQNLVVADQRNRNGSEPPSYTYDELIKRFVDGWMNEVDVDKAKYLINRCAKQSTKSPDKYYISRDSRLKYILDIDLDHETGLELLAQIDIPYLFIRANKGSFTESTKILDETIKLFKKSNPKFKVFKVNGTHYVHLNAPELIAGEITNFIEKHRPCESNRFKAKL